MVALSGGVDSAVAALLAKQAGCACVSVCALGLALGQRKRRQICCSVLASCPSALYAAARSNSACSLTVREHPLSGSCQAADLGCRHSVAGVFVRTWDRLEETGTCSADEDLASAKQASFTPASYSGLSTRAASQAQHASACSATTATAIVIVAAQVRAAQARRPTRLVLQVAAHLGIPLLEADFTAEYWADVFQDLIAGYSRGLTPNPDLACNCTIKFGALQVWSTSPCGGLTLPAACAERSGWFRVQAWVRQKGGDRLVTGHYARLRSLPDGTPSHIASCAAR